jgi:3-deoxy-manno-octulosonate cytidylyltransferase (CMP-KDO synthetase)
MERVAEVVKNEAVDIVVNIQGDEPLIDPKMIDECVEALHTDREAGMGTLLKRVGEEAFEDRSVVKTVRDLRGRALYFSRSLIPFPRHHVEEFAVFEHIGLYAYRKDALLRLSQLPQSPLEKVEGLEQLRALENGIIIQAAETSCTGELVSVDTQADLERVRQILANRVNA